MPLLSSLLKAGGGFVEGLGHDRDRRKQEALAAVRESREAKREALLNALTEKQTAMLGAPKVAEPPQTVRPGEGVRQPDGSYKVEVPDVAKEPTPRFTFVPTASGVAKGNTLTGELTDTGQGNKPTGGGGLSGGALRTAIAENRTQMKAIEAAIGELDANPDAVGLSMSKAGAARAVGALPGMAKIGEIATQATDPTGESARNHLGRVSSVTIKDLSGANVTGPEWQRLGWVPDRTYGYEANRKKLQDMLAFAEMKTQEMERALGGGSASAPAAPGADPDFDALITKYSKKKP